MLHRRFAIGAIVIGLAAAPALGDTPPPAKPQDPAHRETKPEPTLIQLQMKQTPPAPAAAPARRFKPDSERIGGSPIQGAYSIPGSGSDVKVNRVFRDVYHLVSAEGWEGVGILDGTIYHGVFASQEAGPDGRKVHGEHVIDWSDLDRPVVRSALRGAAAPVEQRWQRVVPPGEQPSKVTVTPPDRPAARGDDQVPAYGEYVQVDELPERITSVAPEYPAAARAAGVQGTVMLQALVLKDGSVGDVRIVQGIPELNAAAETAVRQWRYKPAMAKGVPVAVWVATPVKFSIH